MEEAKMKSAEVQQEDMRAEEKQYSASMVAEQATLHNVSKAVERIAMLLVQLLDKKESRVYEPQVLKTKRTTKAERWGDSHAANADRSVGYRSTTRRHSSVGWGRGGSPPSRSSPTLVVSSSKRSA